MANKYVALLLVVCLTVVATVEAEKYQTPCVHDCLSIKCGEHPSSFCKFLCGFSCSSAGMVNGKLIFLHINIFFLYILWNIGIIFFNKTLIVLINQQYWI